jgi:hypothetical protein
MLVASSGPKEQGSSDDQLAAFLLHDVASF